MFKILRNYFGLPKTLEGKQKYSPHSKQKTCTPRAACLCSLLWELRVAFKHTSLDTQRYELKVTFFPEITFWGSLKVFWTSPVLDSLWTGKRWITAHAVLPEPGLAKSTTHKTLKSETQDCRGSRKASQTGESIKCARTSWSFYDISHDDCE